MTEAQGFSHWAPPTGTLGELAEAAAGRAGALERLTDELRDRALSAPPVASLKLALQRAAVGIIAEIKRVSPSRGVINQRLDAADQARAYAQGGAAAISVLTESTRFGGSKDDLISAASAVSIPILKKDFHVARVQLYEARALGSSAALVIVRAVPPALLEDLLEAGRDARLEILVEVRNEAELELALSLGADLIGVNNRNLETLAIDLSTVGRILPLIPRSCVAVAESGFASKADIDRAAASGADAVLVGSFLSAASDPKAAVRELAQTVRVSSARKN